MRGDDGQMNDLGPEDIPERGGRRHAAPRKSLLTKLHMPAGKKAFALAAMPTAVFVGMGLTPKLAMADDSSDIPFAPGPCVTRSDEPSESQDPSPSATSSEDSKDDKSKDDKDAKADKEKDDGAATPKPSASASASDADNKSTASSEESEESSEDKAASSATPTPTESKNPLDPLGVGDALKDLLGGGKDKETAEPSPSASATTATPKPSESATTEPAKKATDAVKGTVDKTTDAIRDAAGRRARTSRSSTTTSRASTP